MEGPSPFIAVVLGGQDFLDPATVTTDTYSYALTDNRLASMAEASGHARTFTYDAAGNSTSKTACFPWPRPDRPSGGDVAEWSKALPC
ncbi:MAG: RHS repeat domain-containing protein [Pseudomonadota bacterium]